MTNGVNFKIVYLNFTFTSLFFSHFGVTCPISNFVCFIYITMTKYMTKITYKKKYLLWHMMSVGLSVCGGKAM